MATSAGTYRIALEFDHGTAHWGGHYASAEDASRDLDAAKKANPEAAGAAVQELWNLDDDNSEWRPVE